MKSEGGNPSKLTLFFSALSAVNLILLFLTLPARAGGPADFSPLDPDKPLGDAERGRRLEAVKPGLSPDEVRRLIGAPKHACRQILYLRCVEQWVYDPPFSVRLAFDCPRGQEPRLQSVQPLVPAGP